MGSYFSSQAASSSPPPVQPTPQQPTRGAARSRDTHASRRAKDVAPEKAGAATDAVPAGTSDGVSVLDAPCVPPRGSHGGGTRSARAVSEEEGHTVAAARARTGGGAEQPAHRPPATDPAAARATPTRTSVPLRLTIRVSVYENTLKASKVLHTGLLFRVQDASGDEQMFALDFGPRGFMQDQNSLAKVVACKGQVLWRKATQDFLVGVGREQEACTLELPQDRWDRLLDELMDQRKKYHLLTYNCRIFSLAALGKLHRHHAGVSRAALELLDQRQRSDRNKVMWIGGALCAAAAAAGALCVAAVAAAAALVVVRVSCILDKARKRALSPFSAALVSATCI